MKFVILNTLAVACLAALAGPAAADAHSSASFSHVTVTLVDLNPTDGIAPTITFLLTPDKYYGGASVLGYAETGQLSGSEPAHEYKDYDVTGAWQKTSVAGSAQTTLAQASSHVTAQDGGVGFSGFNLEGAAQSGIGRNARYHATAGVPFSNLAFTLSANTMVRFSVDATASAGMTVGYTPGAQEGEGASALLRLFAGGMGADGQSWMEDLQERYASVSYSEGGPLVASDSWTGMMAASYSNTSQVSSHGEFWAEGAASGHSVMLAAVPEPSSYAMLLGGMGLMGALARRRNRRAGQ